MARGRNNNKLVKFKKIEPAELTMNFSLTNQTNEFIDVSQIACLLNRRFYRQGLAWAIKGFSLHNVTGTAGSLQISKLPSTWTMSNSWEKGYRAWEDMNEFALEDSESVKPRFLDFKIYADKTHHSLGFGANLKPFVYNSATGAVDVLVEGEWTASFVHIPSEPPAPGGGATRDREIIAVGASYPGAGASGFDAVSLIEGYASSRGLPDIKDPNAPDDLSDVDGIAPENWIGALKNEGTEQKKDVLADMLSDNNTAPYPFENGPNPLTPGVGHPDTMYPGGANQGAAMVLHDQLNVTGTTVSNVVRGRGGIFPCGLIRIRKDATLDGSVLQIHLVAGNHRGYLAESMQDM